MTRKKDRKRLVRQRMAKTGESYTAARANLLARAAPKTSPAPSVPLGKRAGFADAKILEKTGRTWAQWVSTLDAVHATALSHRDVASLVRGTYGVGDWWSQAVTVGYERIKGLREIGQRLDGAFDANKSRTYGVPLRTLFRAWTDDEVREQWTGESGSIVRSKTPSKAVRLGWPDGTFVIAGFTPKGPSKTVVALAHTKLKTKTAAEAAKKAWAARLDALGTLLAGA